MNKIWLKSFKKCKELEESYGIKYKEFSSWNTCKDFLNQLKGNNFYRGQSDASWILSTSFERWYKKHIKKDTEPIPQAYEKLFIKYLENYSTYYQIDEDYLDSYLQKLAFLQHYGAPTRLLDITNSRYIAAYFSAENMVSNAAKMAIYVIPAEFIRKNHHKFIIEIKENGEIKKDELYDIFIEQKGTFVFLHSLVKNFDRGIFQQSYFIATGSVYNKSFLDNLRIDDEDEVIKIVLPYAARRDILSDLYNMNISRKTLFPGLQGFIESLGISLSFKSIDNEIINLDERMRVLD